MLKKKQLKIERGVLVRVHTDKRKFQPDNLPNISSIKILTKAHF